MNMTYYYYYVIVLGVFGFCCLVSVHCVSGKNMDLYEIEI